VLLFWKFNSQYLPVHSNLLVKKQVPSSVGSASLSSS
jgi:hypothetical protein